MNFFYVFLIVNVLVWTPWLWIHKINPYFVRLKINKQLSNDPQWQKLQNIGNLLTRLYQDVNPHCISRREIKRLKLHNDDFIYGEVTFFAFFTMLEKVNPQKNEIFYDLGCGSGKAVFTAALFFDLSKACGIEFIPGLYTLATEQLNKAKILFSSNINEFSKKSLTQLSRINFIQEDFLNVDFSDGDIIYINATCMHPTTWSRIIEKLDQLKSGSRIIVNSKKIQHKHFMLLYQNKELMSWGVSQMSIYKKI